MIKKLQFSIAFALLLVCGKVQAQSAGTLDTSFNIGTGFEGWATETIILQPDEKILVGGWFTSYNGQNRNRIARLNPDGTLDTSFNIGTGFNNVVRTIVLQPDGKILVGGDFTSYNSTTQNRIARLNTDGTLDTSFTIGTGFSDSVFTIALQSDGKILVGAGLASYNGQTVDKMVRLNSDGTLETSFTNVAGSGQYINKITTQPDGKILVALTGSDADPTNLIRRLNTDGTIDTSFNLDGTGFSSMSGYSISIYDIVLQPDGKILAIGLFHYYNGQNQNRIARLNSDGSLDTSFAGTSNDPVLRKIALQPDGKILVGGSFTSYNGTSQNRIARLNTDGTLDTSFIIGTGVNDHIFTITLQPDGKILIGGSFASYNGTSQNRIARLHNDIPVQAQCPDGYVELTSQAEVDAFIVDYPNCTELVDFLDIGDYDDEDSDITDLTPLSNLVSVGGLGIFGNPQLTSLLGLHNLTSVGQGGAWIQYNIALTTLSGLENLTFANVVYIAGNDLLTDMSALQNIDPDTMIGNNWADGLSIFLNPLLEVCNLSNFCTYLQNGGDSYIWGNAENCIDEQAVVNACSLSVEDNAFSEVTVYPNPVKDMLHFSQAVHKITVTDLAGKVLSVQTNSSQTDMSGLQNGVYFITVETENGLRETKKVVKR